MPPNPKSESRNPKQCANSRAKWCKPGRQTLRDYFPFSFFLIPHSNLFRISDFGFRILLALAFTLLVLPATAQKVGVADPLPEELQKVFASQTDYWGEAAMREPNGPSYAFFEKLLPPPRYVHADFRYYPIVLSAPAAKTKARLISNGSGINLRGGARSWNDAGTPVIFRVGPDELRFGELVDRLEQPRLAEGYLPIPEIRYRHHTQNETQVYRLEACASVEPELAENAVVLVK